MNDLSTSQLNFSQHLSKSLLANYKRRVSVVFFVNQFNLRAYGTNTIAYETGRKWLKGMAIPQISKMKVLVKWLDLELDFLFIEDDLLNGQPVTLDSDNIVHSLSVQFSQQPLDYLQAVILDLDAQSIHSLLLSALHLRELAGNQQLAVNKKH
jgi:hypothetical protein